MSKRLKNDSGVELVAQTLNKRFKMFSLTVYDEAQDGTLLMRTVNNIPPAAGRAFYAKMQADDAKVDATTRFVYPDGRIEIYAPAVSTETKTEQNVETDEPREIYRPGQGWVKE